MKEKALFTVNKKSSSKLDKQKAGFIQLISRVRMPTRYGLFELYGFNETGSETVHTALVKGDVEGTSGCVIRIHSECHTGDVLGSMRCDCGEQLKASMEFIAKQECGVLIYLKQEGRGIGLMNKLKAYSLQDEGLDTVQANEALGFPGENRNYYAGAEIIRQLGIKSVVLLTNNPDKIEKITREGIKIDRREPLVVPPNEHNQYYMHTKKSKMRHII